MGVCYNRLAQINGRRAASCEEVQCWAHERVAMTNGAMEAFQENCDLRVRRIVRRRNRELYHCACGK